MLLTDRVVDDDLAVEEESRKMFTVTVKSTEDLENDKLVMVSNNIKCVEDTGKQCSLAQEKQVPNQILQQAGL